MKWCNIFAVMLLASNILHAQIYKWTDSNGVVHFSDVPHQGAEKIIIPEAKTNSPSTNAPTASPNEVVGENSQSDEDSYEKITISQPSDQATIRNNQGYIPIIVAIEPKLKPGDMLQIIYDGEPLGKPQANMVFALNDVNRGTHTIAVQVVNSEGKVLKTSSGVTVYMHRAQAGMSQGVPGNNINNNSGNIKKAP